MDILHDPLRKLLNDRLRAVIVDIVVVAVQELNNILPKMGWNMNTSKYNNDIMRTSFRDWFYTTWKRGDTRLSIGLWASTEHNREDAIVLHITKDFKNMSVDPFAYHTTLQGAIAAIKAATYELDHPIPKGFKSRLNKAKSRKELLELLKELEKGEQNECPK